LISSCPLRPYERAPVVVEPPTVLPPTSNWVAETPGSRRARPRIPRPYGSSSICFSSQLTPTVVACRSMTGASLTTVTASETASICMLPLMVIVAPTSTRTLVMLSVLNPASLKLTWYSPFGNWVKR
jgi:hypothetical protein